MLNACLHFKFMFIFIMVCLFFPIPFYDLYYGFTDHSCVTDVILPTDLNDYLLISGWISMNRLAICILSIYFFDTIPINLIISKNINYNLMSEKYLYGYFFLAIIYFIIILFVIIWNIYGSIIFWLFINNDKCHDNMYNYVHISLIIKYISIIIGLYVQNCFYII